jgi:hypothetical protein
MKLISWKPEKWEDEPQLPGQRFRVHWLKAKVHALEMQDVFRSLLNLVHRRNASAFGGIAIDHALFLGANWDRDGDGLGWNLQAFIRESTRPYDVRLADLIRVPNSEALQELYPAAEFSNILPRPRVEA